MSIAANHNAGQGQTGWPFPVGANSGVLWLGLALLGMIIFFWTGLSSLLVAWERPEYSHGYLIPPIALYLFLTQLPHIKSVHKEKALRRGLGTAIVLFGLVVGLIGNLVNIPDISTYGFIICAAGIVFVLFGTKRGLMLWLPLVYLVFMLPLPNFVHWALSIKLQMISSQIGVGIISFFGVPVYLDGNVIDLGVYKLQVAEACSGLRYMFPLASFGFLFAILYKGPVWHKVALFLSSLPITVAMNCIRIGIIGLLVDRYGIAQAEGFLHFFEGWIIFIACLLVLYLEAMLLQLFVKDRRPIHTMLDIDFSKFAGQLSRIGNVRSTRALVFTSAAILLAGIAWHLTPARAAVTPDRDPLVLFPLQLGDWHGQRNTLDANIERVLAADDYLIADFVKTGTSEMVNLFFAYYKSQTQGSGIHSPEVCIPAGGWEVSKWKSATTDIQMPGGRLLTVNRAIIQKGLNRQLVYYWFEQRGRHLTNSYAAKAFTVWDSVARGRTDGALVRVVTPIATAEVESAADERLQQFLELTLKEMPSYVPL